MNIAASVPEFTDPVNSRRVAQALLADVLDRSRPLDAALAGNTGYLKLSGPDRAFALRLTRTALKRLGQVDAVLAKFIERPLIDRLMPVHHALRLGITQLCFMDVAPHAAVDTTVQLVKRLNFLQQSGLTNAVMRRATREAQEIINAQDITLNTPEWLLKSWGESARTIAAIHAEEPALDITVKSDPEGWAKKLGGEAIGKSTVRIAQAGEVSTLPGFEEGAWWVQDAAAALPAQLLLQAAKGKNILDLCAAPGGKTAQLAHAGMKVTAVDSSAERVSRLKENLARLQLKAEIVVADAAAYRTKIPADAILLDAPCSATGILRRHPEIAWLRKPEEVQRLAHVQWKMLNHALEILKPGGILAYSVCSLQPEEGSAHIARLSETRKDIKVLETHAPHTLLSAPTDGFYIALIEKL